MSFDSAHAAQGAARAATVPHSYAAWCPPVRVRRCSEVPSLAQRGNPRGANASGVSGTFSGPGGASRRPFHCVDVLWDFVGREGFDTPNRRLKGRCSVLSYLPVFVEYLSPTVAASWAAAYYLPSLAFGLLSS